MSLDDYRHADRKGRGFRLTMEQREGVYQALEAYQNALCFNTHLTGAIFLSIYGSMNRKGGSAFPQYDILLVDEAQFFAPLWMAILQKLLKPQNAHLFIVADPTQGFLGRGASWKGLGLQARGRSQQLRRSYRTTREILEFAALFYRLRLAERTDEDILAPDLLNMPTGTFPEMITLSSAQDEVRRVANEVEAFVQKGYSAQTPTGPACKRAGGSRTKRGHQSQTGKKCGDRPERYFPRRLYPSDDPQCRRRIGKPNRFSGGLERVV